MHPRSWELMEAMGNCYKACEEDYTRTLEMISGWRGFTAEETEIILQKLKSEYITDLKYQKLRNRFPKHFPL